MFFALSHDELSDEEIVDILRQSIVGAGQLPRHADVFLAGICAKHLVDGLRAAVATAFHAMANQHGGRQAGSPHDIGTTSAPYRPIEPTRWRKRLAQASDAVPLSGSTSPVFPHVPPRLPSPRLVGVEAAQ